VATGSNAHKAVVHIQGWKFRWKSVRVNMTSVALAVLSSIPLMHCQKPTLDHHQLLCSINIPYVPAIIPDPGNYRFVHLFHF